MIDYDLRYDIGLADRYPLSRVREAIERVVALRASLGTGTVTVTGGQLADDLTILMYLAGQVVR